MGYEYTVYSFARDDDGILRYTEVWAGRTLKEAMKVMKHQAKIGVKCIKLEWRP